MDKPIILFVDHAPPDALEAVAECGKVNRTRYAVAVIKNSKTNSLPPKEGLDILITCDFSKPLSIMRALTPYCERIAAVTCRSEARIHDFARLLPYLPYLRTPTSESLMWATDKISMRERFAAYDKTITPRFLVVSSNDKTMRAEIKEKVGFPLIMKPSNLAASLMVAICYHEEELKQVLRSAFRKINSVYKKEGRKIEPRLLVEELMEGDMYSIDGYVSARGKIYFCPLINIKTGRAIGFDDFFGYQQITPVKLSKASVEKAEEAATAAIRALCLRSTTVHIELMKMEAGWKIIELGPRIGGFRHVMYKHAFGINHGLNDILIRMGKKPVVTKKPRGYAAAFKFFAKEEGVLKKLLGVQKVKALASFKSIKVNKQIGDKCLYAKHSGRSVCDLILFNEKRSELFADIRRAEQMIVIQTEK